MAFEVPPQQLDTASLVAVSEHVEWASVAMQMAGFGLRWVRSPVRLIDVLRGRSRKRALLSAVLVLFGMVGYFNSDPVTSTQPIRKPFYSHLSDRSQATVLTTNIHIIEP